GQLAGVRLRLDSFSEQGGAAALTGAKRSFETGYGDLGLRVAVPIAPMAQLKASAAWQHVFGDRLPAALLALNGGSAFTVVGPPLAKDSAHLSAGVAFNIGGWGRAEVGYSGVVAGRANDNEILGRLTLPF
ncbi:MAG TPA: autotransporter outer membrane beta-barrel domain-containing protein, partial [Caulobacteraceae bacterium]